MEFQPIDHDRLETMTTHYFYAVSKDQDQEYFINPDTTTFLLAVQQVKTENNHINKYVVKSILTDTQALFKIGDIIHYAPGGYIEFVLNDKPQTLGYNYYVKSIFDTEIDIKLLYDDDIGHIVRHIKDEHIITSESLKIINAIAAHKQQIDDLTRQLEHIVH